MSQFHKPRETDYYLRVPTELVVFQEPVLFFFFFLDGIKTLFKRESEKRERGEQEREQERKRERERGSHRASPRAQTLAHRAGATTRWQCYPAVCPRVWLDLDWRSGQKAGRVIKAQSGCLKSWHPTTVQALCPVSSCPSCWKARDKRGSPPKASLALTSSVWGLLAWLPFTGRKSPSAVLLTPRGLPSLCT